MTVWIVTTGNSDIQLNTDGNWEALYGKVRDESPIAEGDNFGCINRDKITKLFPVPARVLGLTYRNKQNLNDLEFPLLKTFHKHFEENNLEYPSKIIVLLTDQSKIFKSEQFSDDKCPYWQDTCTLEPLFTKYFKGTFNLKPSFLTLSPESRPGLEHWNNTLSLVEKTLNDPILKLDDEVETVYVSHQAGTPAISSAVQFVSLGKFQNVKFLVSNPDYDEYYQQKFTSQLIDSSSYWRGMQIQKAKQLIIDGLPGAALTLLKQLDSQAKYPQLEELVAFFNVKNASNRRPEFMVNSASQRIIDSLDLIEIFFKQENYIQGITLLAAAQETFLKAAIVNEINDKTVSLSINGIPHNFKSKQLIKWQQAGLFFIKSRKLKQLWGLSENDNYKVDEIKVEALKKLHCPVPEPPINDFKFMNSNPVLLKWLRKLRPNFQSWKLLEWSCDDKREHKVDRRNRLMHNLLGVTESEAIKYLLGNEEDPRYTNVLLTYQEVVKKPFLKAIKELNLPHQENNLAERLKKIASDLKLMCQG